jgi:Mn2+/Fe2+ NRAMP family transporter
MLGNPNLPSGWVVPQRTLPGTGLPQVCDPAGRVAVRDTVVPGRDEVLARGAAGAAPLAGERPPSRARSRFGRLAGAVFGLLAVAGPGLVVMLADTDAGSLMTAAQSGARWGYRMIVPELALIPVLYVVQEMTARLGVVTGAGHAALIRARFGRGWAMVPAVTLLVSVTGALITEFAGVAGVGELFGVSRWVTVPMAAALLAGLAFTGSYRRVERAGIALGLAELAFLPAMLLSHPSGHALAHGLAGIPVGNGSYVWLLAANVGAVIMPWMIFYQQGAVVDKGLGRVSIRRGRADTAIGAVVTQLVMIAVVITLAAAAGSRRPGTPLGSVGQISAALQPVLGAAGAKILFGAGMLGAALVAALVSSLAAAWGLSETFGWAHTLNQRPSRATAGFYLTYALVLTAGAALVLGSVNLISLAVDVEVMNALLLPIVLGFLLALEATALPPGLRMHGWRRWTTWTMCLAVIGFALYLIPASTGL